MAKTKEIAHKKQQAEKAETDDENNSSGSEAETEFIPKRGKVIKKDPVPADSPSKRKREEPVKEEAPKPKKPIKALGDAIAASNQAPKSTSSLGKAIEASNGMVLRPSTGPKSKIDLPDFSYILAKVNNPEFTEKVERLLQVWSLGKPIPKNDWAKALNRDDFDMRINIMSNADYEAAKMELCHFQISSKKDSVHVYGKPVSIITPPLPIESFKGGIGWGGKKTSLENPTYPHKFKQDVTLCCDGKYFPPEYDAHMLDIQAQLFYYMVDDVCTKLIEEMWEDKTLYKAMKNNMVKAEIETLKRAFGGNKDQEGRLIDEHNPKVKENAKIRFIDGGNKPTKKKMVSDENQNEYEGALFKIVKKAFRYNEKKDESDKNKNNDSKEIPTVKIADYKKNYEFYCDTIANADAIIAEMKEKGWRFDRWMFADGNGQLIGVVSTDNNKDESWAFEDLDVNKDFVWKPCIVRTMFMLYAYAMIPSEKGGSYTASYGVRAYIMKQQGRAHHIQLLHKQKEIVRSGATLGPVAFAQSREELLATGRDGEKEDYSKYIKKAGAPPTAPKGISKDDITEDDMVEDII